MSSSNAPPTRRLIILGSTGSIGVNALAVVEHLRLKRHFDFQVVGLAAGANANLLAEQALRFNVRNIAIANGSAAAAHEKLPRDVQVYQGANAAVQLIESVAKPGDLVLGAMVGAAGIPATLKAIELGCDIALANKETLVAAGALVMPLVRTRGVNLLPVDSEHSAIYQCLHATSRDQTIARAVLTASGGPFRTWSKSRIEHATIEEALNHPTWNMGPKVTIDSASLMNKALEIIEAHWLFDLPSSKIDVVIHPQSLIHSFVEFVDGSVLAQLGPPDMRTPIQYALTWPHRMDGCSKRMDWATLRTMDFEPMDENRFIAPRLAHEVIDAGGTAGAIFNAANEAAVTAFLDRQIPFGRIASLVEEALESVPVTPVHTLADVMEADGAARRTVQLATASSPATQTRSTAKPQAAT